MPLSTRLVVERAATPGERHHPMKRCRLLGALIGVLLVAGPGVAQLPEDQPPPPVPLRDPDHPIPADTKSEVTPARLDEPMPTEIAPPPPLPGAGMSPMASILDPRIG